MRAVRLSSLRSLSRGGSFCHCTSRSSSFHSFASSSTQCKPCHDRARRTFIAFSFEALAILASVCFHDGFNASTEEVHMKIHSTNHQTPMLCTTAAGNHALLG